jgi:hypothetical protein
MFAGFWFHPLGFIIGPTWMMQYLWGSILAAWFIRLIVLTLGGAATVRQKLFPFFIGAFLAGVMAYFLFALLNGYLYFFSPGVERQTIVF